MTRLYFPADAPQIFRYWDGGGVLAYPTEAVYGLGGWIRPASLEALYALKNRAPEKRFLILAARWSQVAAWLRPDVLPPPFSSRPTTYLYPASAAAPEALCWQGKIAIRLVHMPLLQALCAVEPLLSTSANRSGEEPARTAAAVRAQFPQLPIIEGETGGEALPSRLVDWETGTVLRP